MLNLNALSTKRQWRSPALVVFAAVLFGAALVVSSAISRQVSPATSTPARTSDVVPGGVSTTDRQIGQMQERLR